MRLRCRQAFWGPSFSLVLVVACAVFLPLSAHAYSVQEGIGFIAISDAVTGEAAVLEDGQGVALESGTVDALGSFVFRGLTQGRGYRVRLSESASAGVPARVRSFAEVPPNSFYAQQTLGEGYQYVRMRDGTLLSVMVRPPLGRSFADGPFPTVIEYSGYDPANPGELEATSLLASALGYATVGVNMRGSGCSGGAFDLFDLPTTADGYDIVEIVGQQSWVSGFRVGMIGISFSGISQLFVAGAKPPHLGAILPLSVMSDIYRHPGLPGGIFNRGFANSWLRDRGRDAQPAPGGGQGWARKRVRDGDAECLDNQKLRLQTQDPIQVIQENPFYNPTLMDARSPQNWVSEIEVPVFLAGAWQDEQTGSGFASMLDEFPRHPDVKFYLLNGVHSSALEPEVLWPWIAFLDLYIGRRVPAPARFAPFIPVLAAQLMGAGALPPPVPTNVWEGVTDRELARLQFESRPRVQVLFENGAGTSLSGVPSTTFSAGFSFWPPREIRSLRLYFGDEGRLERRRPTRAGGGIDGYRPDPSLRPAQTIPGQGQSASWLVQPDYNWTPLPPEAAVAYRSDVVSEPMVLAGTASVDLWLRSNVPDTDLQITLSEIRSDGFEIYIQSGWLRASHRAVDRRRRRPLDPAPTHLEADAEPLPAGKFTRVRIATLPFAHVIRAGASIRVSVAAPGGDRTRWAFETPETSGFVYNEISRTRRHASRVVLPWVRKIDVPPGSFSATALRGQPSRADQRIANGG
jgi:predicted acyl esterase